MALAPHLLSDPWSELCALLSAPPLASPLEAARRLLGQQPRREVRWLLPELFRWISDWELEMRWVRSDYPHFDCDLAQGISLAREALGALVEGAWQAAAPRLDWLSDQDLRWRRQLLTLRQQHGFSLVAGLDHLGHCWFRGRPCDRQPAQRALELRYREVERVLAEEFPDPRLVEEWEHHWKPRYRRWLLDDTQATQVHDGEGWLQGVDSWLGRAQQQRAFQSEPPWGELRLRLVAWHRGLGPRAEAEAARGRLKAAAASLLLQPRSGGLAQACQSQLLEGLNALELVLERRFRLELREWIAWGDRHYDRWTWLWREAEKA